MLSSSVEEIRELIVLLRRSDRYIHWQSLHSALSLIRILSFVLLRLYIFIAAQFAQVVKSICIALAGQLVQSGQ